MTKGRLLLSSLLVLAASVATGCTSHAPAALGVDTPLVPYVAPDVDELTAGDDFTFDEEEEEATDDAGAAAPAPAPAAPSPTTKSPAQPAKPGK